MALKAVLHDIGIKKLYYNTLAPRTVLHYIETVICTRHWHRKLLQDSGTEICTTTHCFRKLASKTVLQDIGTESSAV